VEKIGMFKRVLLVLISVLAAALALPTRAQSGAPQALLVVGEGTLSAGDRAVEARLAKLGYAVSVRPASVLTSRDLAGAAVVLVSSTASPVALRHRLTGVATPVVTWQKALWSDLGLTGPLPGVDFGTAGPSRELAIAQAQHRMAAGLSGRITVAAAPVAMGWGVPGPGAVWIASLAEDANHAAIFGYEAGAALVTGTAPARRVGLYLAGDAATQLTVDGWSLVDAAVAWAMSPAATSGAETTRGAESAGGTTNALAPTITTSIAPSLPAPRLALLVTGSTFTTGDQALKTRLLNLGYQVTVRGDAGVTVADAADKTVVVISGSVNDTVLGVKLRDVTVPVLTLKALLFAPMGLTGTRANIDWGNALSTSAVISSPTEPLAAGLTGTATLITGPATLMGWGVPGPFGVVAATLPGYPNKALSIRYFKGAPLVGGRLAPAGRVALYAGDFVTAHLTAAGGGLFDAAVGWLAGDLNAAPQVDAGPDRRALLDTPAALSATVYDDGASGPLTTQWSVVSCIGTATLNGAQTAVTISGAMGPCTLRVTASDGVFSTSDDVIFTVVDTNLPPTVNAGLDRDAPMSGTSLTATISDDGLPGPATAHWSVVSGPGGVLFTNADAVTTFARFTMPGNYTLRVTVSDGLATATDDVVIRAKAKVLFVVGASPLNQTDLVLKYWIESLGFTTSAQLGAQVNAGSTAGMTLVVISSTCWPPDVAGKFALVSVPVITLQAGTWGPMGLVATRGITTSRQNSITVAGPPFHPLAGSLRGAQVVTSLPWSFVYGTPAGGGITAATVMGPTGGGPVIIGFEKGVALLAGTAKERRVAIGFSAMATTALSSSGPYFIQRAVAWAAHLNKPPVVSAGTNQTVSATLPATVSLAGSVYDEGLTGPLTISWQQVSGPDTAGFVDAASAATDVTLPSYGTYVLRLSGNDSEITTTSDVTITVTP
jgi:hypothetical protein